MNNDKGGWFLYQNCLPVKGASRSMIYDLQRGKFNFIPNSLYEIIKNSVIPSEEKLIQQYGDENKETIIEYLEFLLNEEYIFQTTIPDQFPKLNLTYEKAGKLDNAIIDLAKDSIFDLVSIFFQMEELGVKHLEIRIFENVKLEFLTELFSLLKDRRFLSISVLSKDDNEILLEHYFELLASNSRVTSLLLHSSKKVNTENNFHGRLLFIPDQINDESCCGNIGFQYFRVNIDMFCESHSFNNCLNRKISIDKSGNIKNCPSDKTSFGQISNVTLLTALENKEFYKKWGIHKDQIETCKDCEFRYMCSDCRVYIEDANNVFSKPAKCSYNPYTCKWED